MAQRPHLTPIAFMSYVRSDDQHDNGRLTELIQRLSAEVRMQTGVEFPIFQDRTDIQWGQNWKQRIEDSIDGVTFLIPIITPSFFQSEACRGEVGRFCLREQELNRNDLILPVYYVSCPSVDNPDNPTVAGLSKMIFEHQYVDWRDQRFEPLTSPVVGQMLARMAVQIRDALGRAHSSPSTVPPGELPGQADSGGSPTLPVREASRAAEQSLEDARGPASKTEPPTRIVDPMGRADHATIADAIREANAGDRILVRPGFYQEPLVIDKPLEIIGDGDLDDIVVQVSEGHALSFRANMGRVANLTLRQSGGGDNGYCVDISQGRLVLEGCDITGQSMSCVAIHGGADPRLRGNRIHDCKQVGVYVYENGLGTLEDNDIFGNALSGVGITTGGNPTLRHNRIHDGKQGGVLVDNNGLGILEDNDILANGLSGVEIGTGGNPTLRRNRIHDGKQGGVLVDHNGLGILEDNDIFGNGYSGVEIRAGSNPTLRGNRINKNNQLAIHVHSGGAGTIEDNDLRDNAGGAWNVSADSEPLLKRARNQE